MKNIQFKGHTLSLKKETKIKIGEKTRIPTEDIVLGYMIGILTIAVALNESISFEKIFLCFAITYLSAILLIGISVGVGYLESKRRFKYLPLTPDEFIKLNISSLEDYCSFLNEFLMVKPLGKNLADNLGVFAIAELPDWLLGDINKKAPKNGPLEEESRIEWDSCKYQYIIT